MTYTMHNRWHNEQGAILVVGMLTLVLLTMIGFAATTTGNLEREMSGNEKVFQQAFYAGELSLISAENVVQALQNRFDLNEGTTPGHYASGSLSYDHTTYHVVKSDGTLLLWNGTDSVALASVPSGLSSVAVLPRYTIEERSSNRGKLSRGTEYGESAIYYFNVTARGTGGGNAAHVLLETVYAKRL